MTLDQVRTAYLNYFKERGHAVIPSASIVPENDPTTLFTGSGMQPLLPFLLGQPHPKGKRLVDSQKSFRAQDIEEVGDNRHTTFFEMLGNWSLGDYFKEEQLPWFFGFLTEGVGLDPQKLYVTVFAGDAENNIPQDDDSVAIWKRLFKEKGIDAKDCHIGSEEEGYSKGMQGGRIFYYNAKKNWWSRAGVPANMPTGEPGGPDSEVFYDFGIQHDAKWGEHCHPNCDCGRFMEIGNSVFMEYIKNSDGTFGKLPQRNVDFGGGLERITAATNNDPDVFNLDVFSEVVDWLESMRGISYKEGTATQRKYLRIILDHLRASMFLIADGVQPSNTDQGYVLRRLLRRAIRYMDMLKAGSLLGILRFMEASYLSDDYIASSIQNPKLDLGTVIKEEEDKFRKTLTAGLKEFERLTKDGNLSPEDAFKLFSTHGFPFEMTLELAQEKNIKIEETAFRREMEKHQAISRAGSEQKFKGGLADHSDMSVKYHTATHLLHKALRDVLGPDATQKGSNITPERLRFDFAFSRKMTPEEVAEVEKRVNERIEEALPVTFEDLPLETAQKKGAIGLFEEKYADKVRLYKVGDYSLEFCGGPHVENTSELGDGGKQFKIQKEEAVAAGVRRIKAILS